MSERSRKRVEALWKEKRAAWEASLADGAKESKIHSSTTIATLNSPLMPVLPKEKNEERKLSGASEYKRSKLPYNTPKTWVGSEAATRQAVANNENIKKVLSLLGVSVDDLVEKSVAYGEKARAAEEHINLLTAIARPDKRVGTVSNVQVGGRSGLTIKLRDAETVENQAAAERMILDADPKDAVALKVSQKAMEDPKAYTPAEEASARDLGVLKYAEVEESECQ